MAEADTHTVQELQANLGDYRLQLQQVETLLLSDHTNAELREMYDNLAEVIQMTEDLLREAGMDVSAAAAAPPPLPAAAAAAAAAGPSSAAAAAARPSGSDAGASDEQQQEQQQQQLATPAELNLPAMLPASVADQIRKAQVRCYGMCAPPPNCQQRWPPSVSPTHPPTPCCCATHPRIR
jgi:survival-of-motor-neuron-related-splicing factor 30